MSKDTVVVPVLSPEWIRKRDRIFAGLSERTVRELELPGDGLTLDQLQAVFEGRNPFEQPRMLSPLEQLVASVTKRLRVHFGNSVSVDPLPASVTKDNMAKWAAFNLAPVFLPGEEIAQQRGLRNWKKPAKWFYNQMRVRDAVKKPALPTDSAIIKRGWYLADVSIGTDHDFRDGTQVFPMDPLGNLISKLRHAGIIGKNEKTPWESRFAITNNEWREKLLPALTDELHGTGVTFRLERAIEFNAIGNIYDKNRGQFNMWEWFDDSFKDDYRLLGGSRLCGGLGQVICRSADDRDDSFAGRPLGCFV